MLISRLTLLTLLALVLSRGNSNADAHHSTVSNTEVEWNEKANCFEVAMRLRISDLEDAISVGRSSRFRIEHHQQRNSEIVEYLSQHFSLAFNADESCQIRWIGCELELHEVWIYLEIVPQQIPSRRLSRRTTATNRVDRWQELFDRAPHHDPNRTVFVRHTALMEIQLQQVNRIRLQRGGTQETISLSREQLAGQL